MGRIKKKDLIEIVKQLQNVNELIDKAGSLILGLDLAECQELAIKLGNYIEEHYSTQTTTTVDDGKNGNDAENQLTAPIIHTLEDYCELIYQMSLPENSSSNSVHKLSKKINKTLMTAQNAIDYNLPADKKQIVFLPYKASMWDSLESIWFAARDDEAVDAYVIPIPYFDKNPDGSVAQWHYEGDQFPIYVPITDWQNYSIPDEKPDVIFIHNPYDDCNYVTSVYPQYYSRELKEYTDCLVYVPYFVMDGIWIGNESIENQGSINSDYIVVQNQYEKNQYKKFLQSLDTNSDLDKKILPYGSPKLDKVRLLTEENISIPAYWTRRIQSQKPKLILMYNTGVGPFLKSDGEFYLKRMEEFINYCVQRNILVLWRPHPLMESTLKSMRMQYYESYMKIKRSFQDNEVGILDESSDMYPAIYLSDAYCGDGSSITWLYRATGKPVAIFYENRDEVVLLGKGDSYPKENKSFWVEDNDDLMEYFVNEKIILSNEQQLSTKKGTCGKKVYEAVVK